MLEGDSISTIGKHAQRGTAALSQAKENIQSLGGPPAATRSFGVLSFTEQASLRIEIDVLK